MTFAPGPGQRRPTNQEALSIELVSGLLIIIAISAILVYAATVITHDQIVRAVQGPEHQGLGVELRRIEPEPNVTNQERYRLEDIEEDSPAAQAGFLEGDLLLTVDGIALDAATLQEDGLRDVLSTVFTRAVRNGDESVRARVYRDDEEIRLELPVPAVRPVLEVEVPIAGTLEPIGMEVEFMEAEDLTPYYAIHPRDGSPAGDIPAEARLLAIDGVEITPDMSLDAVQAMARDEGITPEEEDFEIEVSYSFQRPGSTRLVTVDDRAIIKDAAPTLFVAFIDNFGFFIPLFILGLAYFFIKVALGLRQNHISSARWAVVIFLWMIIGLLIASIQAFWVRGQGGSFISQQPFDLGAAIVGTLPYLAAIIPLGIAYWWLSSVMTVLFYGEESLTQRNSRFAWTLLVPTLAVLILVAARPLEQTFIKSLTNDIFGSTKPAQFVGLENYEQLLAFRPVVVDCQIDDETGECRRARGVSASVQWERTEYETRRGSDRYREAVVMALPWSDTQGLKIVAKDPQFFNSFLNTMRFTIAAVFLELIIGLVIAMVVNSNFAGRGLMRAAMLVPWAIPTVVAATLWQVMLRPDQTGIFNKLFRDLNLADTNLQFLIDTGPWIYSIIAVDVWKTAPFMALLILAGLQTIPKDVYEAAAVDGAGKVRQFFQITLPLLRPTLAVALIFRTLDSLRVFDVFQVLLDPTRPSMATYNYTTMVDGQRQVGYASAVGVLIFIFIFIFTVLYVRFVGIEQE